MRNRPNINNPYPYLARSYAFKLMTTLGRGRLISYNGDDGNKNVNPFCLNYVPNRWTVPTLEGSLLFVLDGCPINELAYFDTSGRGIGSTEVWLVETVGMESQKQPQKMIAQARNWLTLNNKNEERAKYLEGFTRLDITKTAKAVRPIHRIAF